MRRVWLLLFALAVLPLRGQPAGTPVSPEVHPGGMVRFRLSAPKASTVTLTGDWQWPAIPQNLQKDDNGVWSLTVGPLAPAIYIYSFTVDGIAMADPGNPRIKLRDRGSASLVEVPADPPAVWQAQDVPHGNLETNWHVSTVLNGEMRSLVVYTPPGYEQNDRRRYPVLYLLHGSNDTQFGWTAVGQVNFILDNLIAQKKAVPMIIVMPFGYAIPYGQSRPPPGYPPGNNTTLFEKYLLQDVIPTIDAKYRTMPDRAHRSLAGMSMGAEQSLAIFFDHLDEFSSIGAFCPSSFRALETQYPALLNDPAGTNAKIEAFWLGCGRQDPSHFPGCVRIDEVLTAHHITHIWHPTDGVHNYALWQQHVAEFLPLIFRADTKTRSQPSTVTRPAGPAGKGG
jgi:enterochelin esterase-like enzyme